MRAGTRVTGHPINVATGAVYSNHLDVFIPGGLPLVWERRYSTDLLHNSPGPLGPGWTTPYFAHLTRKGNDFLFITPEGDLELFRDPQGSVLREGTVRNLGTFQEITRHGARYVVTRWDPDGSEVRRYLFPYEPEVAEAPLLAIQDETGERVDLVYDQPGRLVALQLRRPTRTLILDYDAHGCLTSLSLKLPDENLRQLARYTYDGARRLVAAHDALGHADRYEYDTHSRITREVLKDGGIFTFTYDETGRCIRTSGLDHYDAKSLRYFPGLNWTEVTDSLGHTYRYNWNASGQIVSETNPIGAISRTEYDEYGRIVAEIGPLGDVTRHAYDDQGNLRTITDAVGQAFVQTFNDSHLPLTLLDPAGGLWENEYDDHNRVIATTDPLGNTWLNRYNRDGTLAHVIDPEGATTRQEFAPDGSLSEATDWNGYRTRYRWDPFGQLIERIGPSGDRTRLEYDLTGNLLKVEFGDGSSIRCTYDPAGNLTSFTDPNGRSTRYRYGPCSRLLELQHPTGASVTYRWSTEPGRLDAVVDERGVAHVFVYDEAGRLVSETDTSGRELRFRRDLADRFVALTNAMGETVTYVRDVLGRVLEEHLPDGSVTTFQYDPLGNITAAENAECTVLYERDALGRVVRELQGDYQIERTYDRTGNVSSMATSLGHRAQYTYDGNGRMISLETAAGYSLRVTRDAVGLESARRLPGGLTLHSTHDPLGRLLEQCVASRASDPVADQGAVIRRRYAYDDGVAVVAIDDARWGRTAFDYDLAQRLVEARGPDNQVERFTYDGAGNVVTEEAASAPTAMEYDTGGRLVRRGSTTYRYDDNGRLTTRIEGNGVAAKRWDFTWTPRDQLRSVRTPDTALWTYSYDAFGRRIAKTVDNKREDFVWDRDVVVHRIVDSQVSTWMFAPDTFEPLSQLSGGRAYSIIPDHIGTPRELVGSTEGVAWSGTFNVWGTVRGHVGRIECPIRFQGQWFDAETGLHYNRFRYYDPEVGRFISLDPIGLLGGLNPYIYARDPVNFVDPLGLQPCPGKGSKAFRSWTRTNTAAGRLPRFSGRSTGYVKRQLDRAGFRQDPARPNVYYHPDGSTVRIDPPHDPSRGPANGGYLGDTNTHYHKEWQDPHGNQYQLDDKGRIHNVDRNPDGSPNRDRTHIIGR